MHVNITFANPQNSAQLEFDVSPYYSSDTEAKTMDKFTCSKFCYVLNIGPRFKRWDYRIVASPDDDRDTYLVKGHFYLELV